MQENKSDDQIYEKNRPTLSNSRSPAYLLNLSLDKIRIVGDFNEHALDFIMNNSPLEMQFTYQEQSTNKFNGYIQTKKDTSTLNFEFHPARAKYMDSSSFWAEWNPNKISEESVDILETFLLQYVSNAHITRLDFAFDFEKDFSKAYLLRKSKSKTGVWYGTDGSVQTRYFGSEKSNKHIKIYNKKIELREKQKIEIREEHLWRVEVTLKGKKLYEIDKMFDNFFLSLPDFNRVDIRERAMIFYLIHNESEWSELAKATRTKYRKLIQEISEIDITAVMKNALEENKERLIQEANSYLNSAVTAQFIPNDKIVGYEYL